ncbi:MAG: TIGR04211 family SH3 domain-containing protein [Thiotrichales bacterium]|nr:MAG: TIGR04211 family SH3 domain-containing protein [Thiotrichales bacterium]
MKNSNSHKHSLRLFLLVPVFLLPATQVWAETRYVSDQLSIPMRTGASNKHRIVSFPKSGAPLEIKETSDDGNYVRVSTRDGKEGWVETQYLMNQASARARIVTVSKQLEKSRAQVKDYRQKIAELESENRELNSQLKTSQREIKSQESSMEKLKRISANPVALANKNKALESQVSQLTASNTMLTQENEQLADQSTQDWFILGAAVSMGSLLFGLLITRINWRRKKSWGDF